MISEIEEAKLRNKLLSTCAARCLPASQVPVSAGVPLIAGFFTVPHSEWYDRLILDRRPQNSRERRLQWLSLPLGPQPCRILLSPLQTIRGSGYDLSTYFTQLKEHESGFRYQAVGRFVYGWQCPGHNIVEDELYVLAMNCLGMGDLNSTDIAQLVHEEALDDHGALFRPGFLRWKHATPVSNLLQGIYIDDGLIAAIVAKNELLSRALTQSWLAKY